MNNKSLITILIILIACCIVVGLFCVFSANTEEDNNMTLNNTTNLTNSTNATIVEESSQSYESSSSQYQDPHPDWVCEGDTWYSVELSEGHYGIYDKESGRLLGTGDMPDRHGYHSPEYLEDQSSTVKYRSDGEYYTG